MELHSRIRKPAAAGKFYFSSAQALKNQVEGLIDKKALKTNCLACMLPHAGYMYSGAVAAQTASNINVKENIILLGPNHTGYGVPFSIMAQGAWQMPFGEIKINSELAGKILKNSKYLQDDAFAHTYEHSIEVELPFLQYFKTDFSIVPIVALSDEADKLKDIGNEIADTIKNLGIKNSTLIVASSDMTHYESKEQAQKKDEQAIEAILELNEDKLMSRVKEFDISMCGYAPVMIMIAAAKSLGAAKAKLIKYQTSGDVTGDFDSVVGYAGIIVY